jgi:uncharacterized repeat protein (TIGR03803 family)
VYGTATDNGFGGSGTVFRLKPNLDASWTETILHTFGGGHDDRGFPWSDLVPDAAGNLYGTTYVGGAHGQGIIYKLTPVLGGDWKETVFHSFNYADGALKQGHRLSPPHKRGERHFHRMSVMGSTGRHPA